MTVHSSLFSFVSKRESASLLKRYLQITEVRYCVLGQTKMRKMQSKGRDQQPGALE
jgi:hypothetical protein